MQVVPIAQIELGILHKRRMLETIMNLDSKLNKGANFFFPRMKLMLET